jgi:F-type H+-transporting ATPase subunit epsilon
LRVEGPEGTSEYVVTGGFAEIGGQGGVSVLAERAVARADMTQEQMDSMVAEAHAVYARAKDNWENEPGPVDDAAKLLADMVAVGDHIGLSSKQPSL